MLLIRETRYTKAAEHKSSRVAAGLLQAQIQDNLGAGVAVGDLTITGVGVGVGVGV
jgi:hypothetical protein